MFRMRSLRSIQFLFLFTSFFLVGSLFADTIDKETDTDDVDIQAIREWINTKRQVTLKEIGGNLSLSGEVRTEFQTTGETVNGVKQRGNGAAIKAPGGGVFPAQGYDIEVNIMLDYRTDRTWAAIKLEFDNNAGVFGGTLDRIKLEKAYWGARILDQDTYYLDFEAGRKRLSTTFDSKLEFNAFFDGLLLKYDVSFDKVGDFYTHVGTFVIDERNNHYGYVGELGLLNIVNTGLYTKLSLIDWNTKSFKHEFDRLKFEFLVSQLLLGYKFLPQPLNRSVTVYLAGLYNFAAREHTITDHKKANFGGYLGFTIGELKKKGDWSFDINYQVLAAQCVPDYDNSGIGPGNAANAGLYTVGVSGPGASTPTTKATAAGNGNYRGFVMTLDYLLSNNINLQQQWQQSITLDQDIGPFRRYKQYEIEFIYGF